MTESKPQAYLDDRAHVFHSWSAQKALDPMVVVGAEGSRFWTDDGRSYHGGTRGAMTMTGEPRRWGSEPGLPGVVHFWGPYLYRSAFHASNETEECERALRHLEDVVMVEGPNSIAAIVLETVVGTNG